MIVQVILYKDMAAAFNEYGEVAKIDGSLFHTLVAKYAYRRTSGSKKSDQRLLKEIVENFDASLFCWSPIGEVNK